MYLALVERVAMALKTPTVRTGTSAIRKRYEPGVHTINNANPYQGITITEGHGKYPVNLSHCRTCKQATQHTKLPHLSISPRT